MTIKEMRVIGQPKDPERPWSWSEIVNRSISIYFTYVFYHCGFSANLVSIIAVLVAFSSGVLLLSQTPWLVLVGGLGFIVWDNLDCSDGEIARIKKTGSLTGLYVDRFTGMLVGPMQFIFLGFMMHQLGGDIRAVVLGIAAGMTRPMATLTSFMMQISALEPLLYNYKKDSKKEGVKVAENVFTPDLDYVGVNQQSLQLKVIWFFYKGIGRHFLMVVAIVLDLFVIKPSYITFYISAVGMYVGVYGILSPLAMIVLGTKIIRNKSTEAYHEKIMKAARFVAK
jgi:phosphatidylglycerophosphate synthase